MVVAAEKHAENLAKLAQELEGWVFEHQRSSSCRGLFSLLSGLCRVLSSVKNASGRPEVRNARDAIDAYKNITDAINAAAAAAKQARTAADRALNVGSPVRVSHVLTSWQVIG